MSNFTGCANDRKMNNYRKQVPYGVKNMAKANASAAFIFQYAFQKDAG